MTTTLTFERILKEPELRKVFEEYCRNDLSLENLICWERITEFKLLKNRTELILEGIKKTKIKLLIYIKHF
jgi:hypothetical protein